MICESEEYHKSFKCASVLDRKIKHPQESQQFVITKISGIVLLQYKFCLNSVFGPNGCKNYPSLKCKLFYAGTIEKAIAAKQTPQLHPTTEICISASPNLTVFH